MHILILVLGTSVDYLDFVEIYKDAARHGHTALAVVLGRAEHGEDSGTLGQRHPLRVRLVGPNDVAALVSEKKAVNGGVAKTHRTPTSRRISESCFVECAFHLIRGRIGPETVRTDLFGRDQIVERREVITYCYYQGVIYVEG